ncbi:MAG: phospholipase C, phosphocholine-specific [Rhodoferax sp.]|uniref:phosphocholine-specific phospholipase C n=1 Tax=Rhodoferax sp. TaxID=50421 RepID=UPI00271D4D62|nr:phospholipase C, phosphocholine-specific [Rhodoferax sp.]MDO8447184.1 phospholipase C, phosphocholine-specific [Rhodoferax sp.]
MTQQDRRSFLRTMASAAGASAALATFPPAIQRALAIQANNRTGTIQDVEHIVILTQENRSFDHYFGSLNGVRGFADPFPVPVADKTGIAGKNVWVQPNAAVAAPGRPAVSPVALAPFHLNTAQNFAYMRVSGTPHSWSDAEAAWDQGRMNAWPKAKANHSMGYFKESDLPFQFAMANAFTICDHYHCSFHGGTNTNRLFLWTGTNDPLSQDNGPSTDNSHDWFNENPLDDYTWTTYPERLQDAGISWQVYQNMADNFTDNSLAGFRPFRDAAYKRPGYSQELEARGISTRDLDKLKEDVLAGKLPQVSWIVATAEGSEHPGPSSPAQGADYTAKVLDALTANPEVWSKTAFFINFDENDGFFDHMPPPAAPSYVSWDADPAKAQLAGASTVDTTGEYHEHLNGTDATHQHKPYGVGPRVPMYVISPWSKGGWVNSEVNDHTSVIRFIEKRFGVMEPNISAWRRAVCGDLSSAFNFVDPEDSAFFATLPNTLALATRARALPNTTTPPAPASLVAPVQAAGPRPARALPYELHATARIVVNPGRVGSTRVELLFANTGEAAAVFHVYDRLNLTALPRRYTVEGGKQLDGSWQPATTGAYDLWVLGPNGFHRHFTGNSRRVAAAAQPNPEVRVTLDGVNGELIVELANSGSFACTFSLLANKYYAVAPQIHKLAARSSTTLRLPLQESAHWYDFSVRVAGQADYSRRFAGHLETGQASISDPALQGAALLNQYRVQA